MAALKKVDEDNFDAEVIRCDRLTLVDVGAEWCAPCRKLHPVMQQLADEYAGRLKVVELDVGESPEVAMRYGVTSVPQLMFVKGGVVRETVVGLLSKSKIQDKIEYYLS